MKKKLKSELATFTILNPDFHIVEDELDRELPKGKQQLIGETPKSID